MPFGGSRHLRLTRLPRHDRGPVPGGNRSAASCLCTVLRRALYHYATRSPNCCGSNPIPKRRQQRVGPAEPLVSTAMRQRGGKGRGQTPKSNPTTHNQEQTNKKGGARERHVPIKRQQDTTRKKQHHEQKQKKRQEGDSAEKASPGNRHTCTYQSSEIGARRLVSQ